MVKSASPRTVAEVDWPNWRPAERAVLNFVFDGDKVLLIHKKTGLGTGKINAPGGRIEPGETPLQAAIRETTEEVRVVPLAPQKRGELFFIFTNGYTLHGEVFFSYAHTGSPAETREADPFWCPLDAIPYEKMWEDDRHWLPLALDGKDFLAYFIFDEDRMLDKRIVVNE
jgi:8-oxo-dGTP diphosphatase